MVSPCFVWLRRMNANSPTSRISLINRTFFLSRHWHLFCSGSIWARALFTKQLSHSYEGKRWKSRFSPGKNSEGDSKMISSGSWESTSLNEVQLSILRICVLYPNVSMSEYKSQFLRGCLFFWRSPAILVRLFCSTWPVVRKWNVILNTFSVATVLLTCWNFSK